MASGLVIVALFENGPAERVISGDVDAAFVGEDVRFDLPIGEAGMEGKGDVFMHGLECLKDKGIACRCGFNTWKRAVSMKLTKREGGRRVTLVLSASSAGRRSGQQESVRTGEEFSGYMDHFEVKVGKVNEPACLAAVKRLGLMKVGKVFMVGEDLYQKGGAVEVVAPGFQGANDCQKFSVIDIIVAFGRGE